MTSTQVTCEIQGGVAWMTLDGAATRNALDVDSIRQIVQICDVIDADSSVGVAVIQGSGGAFCSGAHTSLLAGMEGLAPAEVEARLSAVYEAFARVHALAVPTVAVIDGPAVGAGVNLAMACDLRVATPQAVFLSGFARLGIHPGGGHFNLLARAAGYHTAAAMGMFAQRVDAQTALRTGLVWDVVDDERVAEAVSAAITHLAADPLLARELAASLRETWSSPWPQAVAVERTRQAATFTRKQRTAQGR